MVHGEGGRDDAGGHHSKLAEDEAALSKLKNEVERCGGCRQYIDEIACERLSSRLTELFDRHCLRLAQLMEEESNGSADGVMEEWSEYAKFTHQLAEFAAGICAQLDRGLRVSRQNK